MTAPRRIDVRKLLLGLVLASAVGCGNASSDGACEQGTVGVCNDEGQPMDPEPSGNVRTPAPGEPAISEARSTLRVGETVDFSMYTHCGVESTRINGRVWNAVDPLHSSPERLGPRPAGQAPGTGRQVDVGEDRQGRVCGPGRAERPRPVPNRQGPAPLRLAARNNDGAAAHHFSWGCCIIGPRARKTGSHPDRPA